MQGTKLNLIKKLISLQINFHKNIKNSNNIVSLSNKIITFLK
ncbi:hypothetical protein HMPREF9628_02240 [Peptoanaerobacter stomatis]|uniref:Uncharacterized protein n=1 Tax=Peptoanaerobacter stomatis TaxID=796937 RepID=G9XFC0_9FIRM|nr:hypothetical protein HMPREF9628_02240 [Peptoanaerobacter stomatis]